MYSCRSAPVLGVTVLAACLCSWGSDQQQAQKQASRVTAMAAANSTARVVVSGTISDALSVPRAQLVRERKAMHLSYGALFIAHQLNLAGAKMLDIAVELQDGKDIFQIGQEQNANWRTIADAAKRLNSRIEDNIYKHFLHTETDTQRTLLEHYDPDTDIVRADTEITPDEFTQARNSYTLWRNRASTIGGRGLDPASSTVLSESSDSFKGGTRPHQ